MLEIRVQGLRLEAYPAENPRYRSRLLMVHGLWSGAWCWRGFGSFLAHRGWEVLGLDLRGRPGSREASLDEVTVEDYRRDLATVLSSEALAPAPDEGRDASVVIGHDLGGLLGLDLAGVGACRAAVALAPPFAAAMTRPYRRALAGRWLRRRIEPPPAAVGDAPPAAGRLQADSRNAGRAVVRGALAPLRSRVPALVVAGERDPFLERKRLEEVAAGLGCDFVSRPAGHWGLDGPGFERHVDQVHRWLVRRLGPDLLRLSGYEDLDEDPADD